MALFDEVFKATSIYDMLFFNAKSVLIYPTLTELELGNSALYQRWKYISETKFDGTSIFVYEEKAVYYPEFTKIVAITYGEIRIENDKLKRSLNKIVDDNEKVVIDTFMNYLYQLSSDGVKSTPPYFPMFTGHNIINYDIPLLIKRSLLYRNRENGVKPLPLILKRTLSAKPWESVVIDTVSVWKFNGNDYTPLMLIADYLGLKKTVEIEALPQVSKTYWELVKDSPNKALEYVSLQSANQVNLVIQLMNELRQL
jgi:hypothetical protein